MYYVGTCADGLKFIESKKECRRAAESLGLEDTTPATNGLPNAVQPHGCYWKAESKEEQGDSDFMLWFNSDGNRTSTDTTRVSICKGACQMYRHLRSPLGTGVGANDVPPTYFSWRSEHGPRKPHDKPPKAVPHVLTVDIATSAPS